MDNGNRCATRDCATIVLRLTGAAKDLAEELTPEQLQSGGSIPAVDDNGNRTTRQVNAVTYLMHQLQTRFGPLDEETRLKAVHEWNTFRRRPNESISATLTRFEQTQMRAEHDAGLVQPYETTSYKLLQILGFTDKETIEIIKPFGYRMPNTREEYTNMCLDIRRQLRLTERHPGNIGQYLRGPSFYVEGSDPSSSSSNYNNDTHTINSHHTSKHHSTKLIHIQTTVNHHNHTTYMKKKAHWKHLPVQAVIKVKSYYTTTADHYNHQKPYNQTTLHMEKRFT